MSVRKVDDGNKKPWVCDVRPNGRNGKRIRKRFATKGEALAYEKFILKETDEKPWLGEKRQSKSLMDMIDLWHERHGKTLSNQRSNYNKLKVIARAVGDPLYHQFTPAMFSEYRSLRLNGEIEDLRGIKKKIELQTCNAEMALLNSVISELQRTNEWKCDNPLNSVRKFKVHETEMSFLTLDEIEMLLHEAKHNRKHKDIYKVIKLCLSTGARCTEAKGLTGAQLSKYKVTFTKTKGKKNRTVPISSELYHEIYKEGSGPLFQVSYSTLYLFITKLIPRLKRQAIHTLRHTFASYYMMNGGSIISLQRTLGHTDIKQTMRYSHLSPDHLEDVITKNPLAMMKPKQ